LILPSVATSRQHTRPSQNGAHEAHTPDIVSTKEARAQGCSTGCCRRWRPSKAALPPWPACAEGDSPVPADHGSAHSQAPVCSLGTWCVCGCVVTCVVVYRAHARRCDVNRRCAGEGSSRDADARASSVASRSPPRVARGDGSLHCGADGGCVRTMRRHACVRGTLRCADAPVPSQKSVRNPRETRDHHGARPAPRTAHPWLG